MIEDIETLMDDGSKSCHTDGVGTISPELGDMIWAVMCEASSNYRINRVKPSVVRPPCGRARVCSNSL